MISLTEVRFSDRDYANPLAPWRLTLDEYLEASNKRGASHPHGAYEARPVEILDDPDPPVEAEASPNRWNEGWFDVFWTHRSGRTGSKSRVSPLSLSALVDGKPVMTPESILKYAREQSDSQVVTGHKTQYWWADQPVSKYPHKLATVDGVEYRAMKEHLKYTDGSFGNEVSLAAFKDGKMVGQAVDEWGGILVTVAPEERGRGIGSRLSHYFRAIRKPNRRDSGGYTDRGRRMAASVWRLSVADAKKLGWYQRAVKDGTLTKEKADGILSQAGTLAESVRMISAIAAESLTESRAVRKPANLVELMKEVSLGKDSDGYYVFTHRCRSDSYERAEDIPRSVVDRIASTG